MTIPTFNNGQGGQSIRLDSLNEAIGEVNDLSQRVGGDSAPGIVALDSGGDAVRRSIISSDGSVSIIDGDGVAGDPDVSVSDQLDNTQRNLQMDEQVYKIIRDTLGPDAPLPYVLDEANGVYPHTTRGDFARLGGAWQWDRFRKLVEVGADVRRDSFDPATGAPRGRLYEPEADQRLDATNDFLSSYWTRQNLDVEAEPGGPFGESFRLAETDDVEPVLHYVRRDSLLTDVGANTLRRVYFRDGNARYVFVGTRGDGTSPGLFAVFDLQNEVVVSQQANLTGAGIRKSAQGFLACWITYDDSLDSAVNRRFGFGIASPDGDSAAYQGDGTRWVEAAAANLFNGTELLLAPVLSQATRPPDLPTYPLTSDWFNPEEGTFVVVSDAVPDLSKGSFPRLLAARNDAGTEKISAFRVDLTRWRASVVSDSIASDSAEVTRSTENSPPVQILSWGGGQLTNCAYGSAASVVAASPAALSTLEISGDATSAASSSVWAGSWPLVLYMPIRLTEAQCLQVESALSQIYFGGSE